MKITQHMIEQAAVIANAKVGDELEESVEGCQFRADFAGYPCIGGALYTYRIKPQPRTVWVNEYCDGSIFVHPSETDAKAAASGDAFLRIAVEYREVVPDGTP